MIKATAASKISGSNLSGRFARTTSSMIHFVTLRNTITIKVPKIAHVSVPAANHGYRFRYANTRQTVFIARQIYQKPANHANGCATFYRYTAIGQEGFVAKICACRTNLIRSQTKFTSSSLRFSRASEFQRKNARIRKG